MKPTNWSKFPIEDKIDFGQGLLKSYRGSYLLAQALHEAITAMKKVPKNRREVSNIEDMEVILETCFTAFEGLFKMVKVVPPTPRKPKKVTPFL